MPAILDIPEVRQRVSRLSVAYHQLGEFNENGRRTELIRGIIIEKVRKSPLHATLAKRLYDYISPLLPKRFVALHHNPLTFRDSEPEPDVAVVRGAGTDFLEAHPTTAELVIRVGVASATLDREIASLYAEAGVKEYWIVLGNRRQVEVYRRPSNGKYQTKLMVGAGDTIECSIVPGLRLRLADLYA